MATYRNWERKKLATEQGLQTRCRSSKIDFDLGLTSANECVLSCRDMFRINTFLSIVDQLTLALINGR